MRLVHGMCGDADGWADQAVVAFFSFVCPGLWPVLDEGQKDRDRADADIGFTDLRSPSLDATAADRAAVSMPALVLTGDHSRLTSRGLAHRLTAALPDARFVELEACGQVTDAGQPHAFTRAVSVFAAELSARTTAQGTIR